MLNWVVHETSFLTSGPAVLTAVLISLCLNSVALFAQFKLAHKLLLHGPWLLPDKAKFTVRSITKQLSTIAFDETSSYWSAPKNSLFLGFSLVTTRLSCFHRSAFRNH